VQRILTFDLTGARRCAQLRLAFAVAIAPSILLCERCGYNIETLPPASNCSECGVAVAESHPERRNGSFWQQKPGAASWFRTGLATLRHPAAVFRSVRLDVRSGVPLLAVNVLAAAIIVVAPWSGILIDDPIRAVRAGQTWSLVRTAAVVIPLQVLCVAAVLALLTIVEWAGIQFFARRKGARLCRLAAWQVVAHASYGWIVAAACVMAALTCWRVLYLFPFFPRVVAALGDWAAPAIPGVGALAGLLVFEMLVYVGVYQCRFANRPRPHEA
jgi:hypothetical protein